jgi:hypothetical protein
MENDEVAVDTAGRSGDQAIGRSAAAAATPPAPTGSATPSGPVSRDVRIDFDGIESRAVRVPIEADNISGLQATKGALLYVVTGAPYYSRAPERRPVLNS